MNRRNSHSNIKGYTITNDQGLELVKWTFNVIIMKLIVMLEILLRLIEDSNDSCNNDSFNKDDLLLDINNMNRILLSRLDTSIKVELTKRGVTFTSNIYTGFDTEYVNIDNLRNELISAQMSVCTALTLKIPYKTEFKFESIDVLSGKDYPGSDIKNRFSL